MYCPNCAAPIDGAKFCRSCGANVSLVPQAMTGEANQLDGANSASTFETRYSNRRRRRHDRDRGEPNVENITTSFFTGIGCLVAAFAILRYAPAGFIWWWALLIPAFAMMGESIGKYLRWKEQQRKQFPLDQAGDRRAVYPSSVQDPVLPAPTTSELAKPPNITEHTTRNLESGRSRK
jgi:hypothetical protein